MCIVIGFQSNTYLDPESADSTLRRLQTPLKNGFNKVINEDMKKIYGSHNKYQKALDKVGSLCHIRNHS